MFRIIQSDYTSRGITKVRDAIKNAKLSGQTPVLADTMSLNALAEFALECKKESVDGLVGLRVPLNVQGNHGNVTLMAKTSEGLSNLASIIEAGVEHDSIPISALQSHMKGVSCLIDHDSPMASSGSENAYREFFLALKNLLPSNDIYFSVYQYEDGHLERHSKINQHNNLIAKWLDAGKKDSLKEHCLPVAYESYSGGKAAYQRMMGRYLALNSVNSPSVRKAKGELPEWMDGSSISGELKHDFLEESKAQFFYKTESGYLGSILKDEEVVDLGVDWSLRKEMYGMLSDYLIREGIQHQADVYTARLESELEVVEREGFEPYFKALISYAKYCAAEDIPTKIRGSGASSLVCFLAGLSSSQCDPIKHKLDFRRFMGARIETPDIDLDVAAHKRNSIYDFLHHHVSEGSVGALATQGRQVNLHTLFEQAREVMLVRYGDGEQYDFQIPKVNIADYDLISELKAELGKYSTKVLSELKESSPILKSYMKRSPYIRELVSIGMELDGLRGNPTPHPSAIVVNDHSVRPIPFVKGKDGIVATVPHEFAKSVGLLKYDILSSKVIQGLDLAKSRLKETFETNVAKCFEGDGEGIYQFIKSNPVGLNQLTDSESSLKCLVDINPNSFPELAAFSALIRPGVSDRKDYLKRSKNKAFDDKEITDFLSDTRGFVIYEDQILQICIDIAGMSPTDADTLRTGLKKGIQSLIDSQRDMFIKGLVSRGRDKNIANKIWGRLCKYKGVYLFNKAHATEYAITTVEQALIKRDYPHVFLDTVVYNFDEDKSAKGKIAPKYITELMSRGVTFSYPDINRVHANMSGFIKEGSGVIYPSLRFYGLSERMQGSLTSAKRFGSVNGLNDFLQKTLPDYLGVSRHSLLNVPAPDLKSFKSEMGHLIKFGFFDQVGISEDVRLDELNTIEKRNILLQASDQLVDYLVDPFPESSEPNLTFIGKLEYTDNEYSELLKKQFGTENVLFDTNEVFNQSVWKAIKRNI